MEQKKQLIFQVESPVILDHFKTDNYQIEYDDQCEQDLCVIYFSSHDLYYPNTLASFEYSVRLRDKYEWKKNRIDKAKKHIFVRDIRKQWYIGGINHKIDSPHKLFDFFTHETKGYRIYTVGSSAGGFAAILYGSLLKAQRVYAFNAQLNLNITIEESNYVTNPILFNNLDNNELNKYFDLSSYLNEDTYYYYFQSSRSKMDIVQFNGISEEAKRRLKRITFFTSNHGFPFLRINLSHILSFDDVEIQRLQNKNYHPIYFSIQLIGFFKTFKFVLKALVDRYKKKKLEATYKY